MRHLLLYYPLDDPLFTQEDILATYIRHHCDIIEIAVPVEDPVLDGPVIRDSMARILSVSDHRRFFEDIRKTKEIYPSLKIELMAYRSFIEEMGVDAYVKQAQESGVSYLLSPDADEALNEQLKHSPENRDMQVITFSSLSAEEDEMKRLEETQGYIFQRSTDGKTGKSAKLSDALAAKIQAIKQKGIRTPVVVGFGISEASQAEDAFAMGADGIVIGSALFRHIQDKDLDEYLKQFDPYYE